MSHHIALIGDDNTETRTGLLSSPLQTPIPKSESEMLLIIAAVVWFLIMFMISRRLEKMKKRHSEVISFLVFVVGLLIILFIFY